MDSTSPVRPLISTMSPTEMLPSIQMKKPEMTSLTSVCAPKPTAMPPTPATARMELTLTPKILRTTVMMMK